MRFWLPQLFSVWLLGTLAWAETPRAEPAGETPAPAAAAATTVRSVYVIPVREQIGSAVLYVVRRGIKEAIEQKAD
ncbi:MAG TPA: hypothetical protein VEQ65_11645, partial [Opitutus sp.]|nr:hypothetical protein [Opitutus sp.]